MVHETIRLPKNVGAATPQSSGPFEDRLGFEGCGSSHRFVSFLGIAVEGNLRNWWQGGFGPEAGAWSAEKAGRQGAPAPLGYPPEGRIGLRVPERYLDIETHCPGDPEGIRDPLPSKPCVENPPALAMELPSP